MTNICILYNFIFPILFVYSTSCALGHYCAGGRLFKCPVGSTTYGGGKAAASECTNCIISMGYTSNLNAPSTYVPLSFDSNSERALVATISSLVSDANGFTGWNSASGNAAIVGYLQTNETTGRSERLTNNYVNYVHQKLVEAESVATTWENQESLWVDGSESNFVTSGNYGYNDTSIQLSNYFIGSRLLFNRSSQESGEANLWVRDLSVERVDITLFGDSPQDNLDVIFDSNATIGWFIGEDYKGYDALLTYAIFKEFSITTPLSIMENLITAFGGLQRSSRLGNAMTGQFSKLTEFCHQSIKSHSTSLSMNECFNLVNPFALSTHFRGGNGYLLTADSNSCAVGSDLDTSITGFLNYIIYLTAYVVETRQFEISPAEVLNNAIFEQTASGSSFKYGIFDDYRTFTSCPGLHFPSAAPSTASLAMIFLLQRLSVSWVLPHDPHSSDNYFVLMDKLDEIYAVIDSTDDNLLVLLNILYYRNAVPVATEAVDSAQHTSFTQLINGISTAFTQLDNMGYSSLHGVSVFGPYQHAVHESERITLNSLYKQMGPIFRIDNVATRFAYHACDNFASGFGLAMIDGGYAPGWSAVTKESLGAVATASGIGSISFAFEYFQNVIESSLNLTSAESGMKSREQIGWATYSNSFPIVDICAGSGVGGAIANYAALMGHCRSVITFGAPKFSYDAFHPAVNGGQTLSFYNGQSGPQIVVSPYTVAQGLVGVGNACRLDSLAKYSLTTFTRRALQNSDPLVDCSSNYGGYPTFNPANYKGAVE